MTRKKHTNTFLPPTQTRKDPANLFTFFFFFFVCFLFPWNQVRESYSVASVVNTTPIPLSLAFLDFLAVFLCDFPCFLGALLLSFPRIWPSALSLLLSAIGSLVATICLEAGRPSCVRPSCTRSWQEEQYPKRERERYIKIYVDGTFRVYVAFLASGKITENVVQNGVHRYKMLYFPGILQEPTVNTVKTRILWVCDVLSQTLLAASKHCKTSCFRCLTLKTPTIAKKPRNPYSYSVFKGILHSIPKKPPPKKKNQTPMTSRTASILRDPFFATKFVFWKKRFERKPPKWTIKTAYAAKPFVLRCFQALFSSFFRLSYKNARPWF